MKVSVFIENDSIKMLAGNMGKGVLEIVEWRRQPLPPECVVGGAIINEDPVREALAELKKKSRTLSGGAGIVINSNNILIKKITAPDIPEKKLFKLVESEFANMAEGRGELLYDYMTLKTTGASRELLCAAAEKTFIGSYVSLFTAAGIKIRGINTAAGALANLADTGLVGNKTCVICVADQNTLNSVLFVDGAFAFYNHTRLFSERGTRESFEEIGRTISSLVQFNTAEKKGKTVGEVLFGGLESTEIAGNALPGYIEQTYAVAAREFGGCAQVKGTYNKQPFQTAQYLYCIGDLYKGGQGK